MLTSSKWHPARPAIYEASGWSSPGSEPVPILPICFAALSDEKMDEQWGGLCVRVSQLEGYEEPMLAQFKTRQTIFNA